MNRPAISVMTHYLLTVTSHVSAFEHNTSGNLSSDENQLIRSFLTVSVNVFVNDSGGKSMFTCFTAN